MRSSIKFLMLISLLGLFYVIPMAYAQNELVVTPNTLETALLPGASISETKEVNGIFPVDPGTGDPIWAELGNLYVKTTLGYEAWLTSVSPPDFADVYVPGFPGNTINLWPYTFEITITVPASTIPGVYEFDVIFYTDDWGTPTTVEAHENVKITVLPSSVIPELPFGTVSGILVMLAATGLIMMRKH